MSERVVSKGPIPVINWLGVTPLPAKAATRRPLPANPATVVNGPFTLLPAAAALGKLVASLPGAEVVAEVPITEAGSSERELATAETLYVSRMPRQAMTELVLRLKVPERCSMPDETGSRHQADKVVW